MHSIASFIAAFIAASVLGDASKFMNGYLFQPAVTGFEEDKTWGQINGKSDPINMVIYSFKKGGL